MRQEVYRDDRPLRDWSEQSAGRVFVHLVTPPEWRRITGGAPPPSPVDRAAYTRAGLQWFDYYDQDAEDLAPADTLQGVQPAGDWIGDDHEPWQEPSAQQVTPLEIEARGARLRLLDTVPVHGDWPRHTAFSPDGRLLFVANQRSNSVTVFHVDRRSGELRLAGEPFASPVAVCALPL